MVDPGMNNPAGRAYLMRIAPTMLLCLAIAIQVSAKPKHPVVVQVVKRHVLTWSRNPSLGTVSGRLAYVKAFIWRGTIEQAAGANEELYTLHPLYEDSTPLAPGIYQGWVDEEPVRVSYKIEIEVIGAAKKRHTVIYQVSAIPWPKEWDDSEISPARQP